MLYAALVPFGLIMPSAPMVRPMVALSGPTITMQQPEQNFDNGMSNYRPPEVNPADMEGKALHAGNFDSTVRARMNKAPSVAGTRHNQKTPVCSLLTG